LKKNISIQEQQVIERQKELQAQKLWVTTEMLQKMEERRKVKHMSLTEAKKEYRKLNNELRRETEKAKA